MKSILKLSLVSLCASGAVVATTPLAQAHNDDKSAKSDSDKQLVVTEPAGAETTTQQTTTYQTDNSASTYNTGTSYSSGASFQSSSSPGTGYWEASGAALSSPRMVTGRDQDAYANCILHRYQAGKGSARATDEHYWNNVNPDRMYAQYGGASGYQNFAYNTSYSSPRSSSSWSSSSGTSSSWNSSAQMRSGQIWYGPDGRMYNAQGQLIGSGSAAINESAGSSSSGLGSSSSQQQKSSVSEPSGASQSSATQYGTSGAQSSTELKGSQSQSDLNKSSQNQPGTATSEAAGANTTTSPDQNQSGTQSSPQSSSSATPAPDQTSTSSSTSTPDQSAQSSSTSSSSDMSEKVRSTLKSDSTLSPISSNVTVQDQNGKVALNGTVKSEAEKQQVVSKAEELAGSGNVIDNLQVKSDNSNP